MDRLLGELAFENLASVSRDILSLPCVRRHFPVRHLPGCDLGATAQTYDRPRLVRARRLMVERLCATATIGAPALPIPGGPTVVLIDRGDPDPFFSSGAAEIPTASNQRRSVPNFVAVHEAVRRVAPNTRAATLEDTSLRFQARLFRAADIVIAQHGAALGNILWMRPGAQVVEIRDRGLAGTLAERVFARLARAVGVEHHVVPQEHPHAAVDPGDILEALRVTTNRRAGWRRWFRPRSA